MFSAKNRAWIAVASVTLLLSVLLFGFSLGKAHSSADKNLAAIQEAWRIIHQEYVDPGSINSDALRQAAIQAMLDTLNDSHSAYLDQQAYNDFLNQLMGSYEGIGISFVQDDGKLIISRVYLGTPAEKAGLKSGDVILEVNGLSTSGMTSDEFSALVMGAAGTKVSLKILRQNSGETVVVEITREKIQYPCSYFEMIGDIAYIDIMSFGASLNDELGIVLRQLSTNGAKGIIIDLRNNPGGFVYSAVDAVSRFVKDGVVLTELNSDGTEKVHKTTSQKETTDLPVVVLVNRNSASASEVFSGALQDHGRAVIAGEVTYGKGSVNQLFRLPDGSAIYLTIARWMTPSGKLIEGNGVTPDIKLGSRQDWIKWAVDYLR